MEFTSAAWLEECQFPRRFKNILPTEAEIFSALQRENTERLEDIMGHHSSHVTWSVIICIRRKDADGLWGIKTNFHTVTSIRIYTQGNEYLWRYKIHRSESTRCGSKNKSDTLHCHLLQDYWIEKSIIDFWPQKLGFCKQNSFLKFGQLFWRRENATIKETFYIMQNMGRKLNVSF